MPPRSRAVPDEPTGSGPSASTDPTTESVNAMSAEASAGSTRAAGGTASAESVLEEATERIRDLNERILTSAKAAGLGSLDAYERALESLVDFEQRAAGATQLEWVSAVADAHARFINEVSGAYVKAARDMLK